MNNITNTIKRMASIKTDKIYSMPIVILMPHSRCNCRCVMCDIWKANKNKKEITLEDLRPHLETFKKLNVKWVALSGGEALMHSNLWVLCRELKKMDIKISLLSTGLLLHKNATDILENCDDVIISLDGSEEVHNTIRNIPNCFEKVKINIAAMRSANPDFKMTGRSVIQRLNYKDFPNIIKAAHELQLNEISFLPADVSTSAFNREQIWGDERCSEIALSPNEVEELKQIIEQLIIDFKADFDNGFISESREKIRNIYRYYGAINGSNAFPEVSCNAPWVSTVIESNGDVHPCFFFPKIGNIKEQKLEDILNSPQAIALRKSLDVKKHPTCQKCVCTLSLSPFS